MTGTHQKSPMRSSSDGPAGSSAAGLAGGRTGSRGCSARRRQVLARRAVPPASVPAAPAERPGACLLDALLHVASPGLVTSSRLSAVPGVVVAGAPGAAGAGCSCRRRCSLHWCWRSWRFGWRHQPQSIRFFLAGGSERTAPRFLLAGDFGRRFVPGDRLRSRPARECAARCRHAAG